MASATVKGLWTAWPQPQYRGTPHPSLSTSLHRSDVGQHIHFAFPPPLSGIRHRTLGQHALFRTRARNLSWAVAPPRSRNACATGYLPGDSGACQRRQQKSLAPGKCPGARLSSVSIDIQVDITHQIMFKVLP